VGNVNVMETRLSLSRKPFSLEHTLGCGQAFRWEKVGEWWFGVVGEGVLKVRQAEGFLLFEAYPRNVGAEFLSRYFRLDDDLPLILSEVNKDEHVNAAISRFFGLRIMRQDPWECLISYICAANKNIPAIKNMISNLCERFGEAVEFEGRRFFTFPKPAELAEAGVEELRLCKLGFRAERVLKTAQIASEGELDLESLRRMRYWEARRELLALPGVGPKVADCVLLFALDKLMAFPVDVWMKRIVLDYYSGFFERSFVDRVLRRGSLSPSEYEAIGDFGRGYFGEYVGYAQEYLFHFRRCQSQG